MSAALIYTTTNAFLFIA